MPQKCGHTLMYKIPNCKKQITNKSQISIFKFQTPEPTPNPSQEGNEDNAVWLLGFEY